MKQRKEIRTEIRLDNDDWFRLNELTLKYRTDRSKLIRTLILKEYEEQSK